MADIRPFSSIRPKEHLAERVAALPYDVYSREEARKEVIREPISFLKIDRADTQFHDSISMYDERVYYKAKDILNQMIEEGIFIEDSTECYYIYELIMEGRHQTGIVGCVSIDDYLNHTIKKHEDTREDKEIDRINHIDVCNAQTGPIFLAYRNNNKLTKITSDIKKQDCLYSFESTDHIHHNAWRVSNPDVIKEIKGIFSEMKQIYIADGHHRAASAVKVGLKRRKEEENSKLESQSIKLESDYFLSVLFPDNELMIYPYYRVVKDLNGLSKDDFLQEVKKSFDILDCGDKEYQPDSKLSYGMYIDDHWYRLSFKKEQLDSIENEYNKEEKIIKTLNVSILQNFILSPILGITDPRIDKRIDFVGGIRGTKELEKRVKEDMVVAFTLYPTSIEELFMVADLGKRMPPKSTWFEPKLRSGLFLHSINSKETNQSKE
ncbi:DUF1015 domain-containing protein [Anaeromicropila herbilytica]|uniref:DUF1015 domain-containing protein n=1 Tax=Anaeromicropila herbilytica TaxID=2785025 RepID=A0A7R7ENF7_9FIRM|nr:DUF1015 family protein [Anaeromicropila herbilytica]BCN32022.1 hypothetical protein bsdtb5_33170 [Anaeromicropila herbilytica]